MTGDFAATRVREQGAGPAPPAIRGWLLDEWSMRTWRVAGATLLTLTGLAIYLAELIGSQFYSDDFLYLQLAQQADVTPQWFALDNYGHFAPITRLAYLLVQRWLALDYAVAAVLPALLAVGIVAPILAISRRMIGRRAGSVGLALLAAQSILLLRVALWWGASVHVMGAAAAYLACIASFVAFCQTRQIRYQVLSVLSLLVALLVQERPLIIIGYLVLIRYLFRCGLPWRGSLRGAVWADRMLWLPYIVLVACYLWYRLFVFAANPTPADRTNAAAFFLSGIGRSFLPAVGGVTSPPDSGWLTLASVAGMAILITATAMLAAVRKHWWRVAAFVVLTYSANMGLMALGRQVIAPIEQSRDLQYFLDPFLALPIAFALGLGCLPRREPEPRPKATLRGVGLIVGLACALSIANLATWVGMVKENGQSVANAYLNRAEPALRNLGQGYDLLRFRMPPKIVPDFIAPWDDQSAIFALDPTIAGQLDPTSQTKVAVLPTGDVAAVRPVTTISMRLDPSNTSARGGAVVSERQTGMCVTAEPGSGLQIELSSPVDLAGLFYGLRYESAIAESTRAVTLAGNEVAFNWHTTALPAGSGREVFDRLEGGRIDSLILAFADGVSDLCVSDIWIGRVAAADPSGCSILDQRARAVASLKACDESWSGALDTE